MNFILNFLNKDSRIFQDHATMSMENMIHLHDYIMFYLVLVFIFVVYMFTNILIDFWYNYSVDVLNVDNILLREDLYESKDFTHNTLLEIIWTLTPSLILLHIAIPSFALLYQTDEVVDAFYTIKVIGNQWYWTYEVSYLKEPLYYPFELFPSIKYSMYKNNLVSVLFPTDKFTAHFVTESIDSYLVTEMDLELGEFRLLEVTDKVILPTNIAIQFIITASDVLHSWAIPSLGIKMDAVPGRLNQVLTIVLREGTFYGQCSEICGSGHGFMPICIEFVEITKL
jgi:cytochrome c oxidase subunit 2